MPSSMPDAILHHPIPWATQQSELQRQRYTQVMAAATGMFTMQVNGDQAIVTYGTSVVPFAVLPRLQLLHQLNTIDLRGGLNYVAGEPSVFWTMIKNLHTEGSTGSPI